MEKQNLDSSKEYDIIKEKHIHNLYMMIRSVTELAKSARKAEVFFNKLKSMDGKSASKEKKERVENFKNNHAPLIKDAEASLPIYNNGFETLSTLVKSSGEYISPELQSKILNDIKNFRETGVEKTDDIFREIKTETSIAAPEKTSLKPYNVSEFYTDISNTYYNIAKGLQKTIEQLDDMIEQLDCIIETYNIKEDLDKKPAQKETTIKKEQEDKTTHDSAPKRTSFVPSMSVEEIEMGMGMGDEEYFNEIDEADMPNETLEIEENETDISDSIKSIFGDVGETSAEDDEPSGMKP